MNLAATPWRAGLKVEVDGKDISKTTNLEIAATQSHNQTPTGPLTFTVTSSRNVEDFTAGVTA